MQKEPIEKKFKPIQRTAMRFTGSVIFFYTNPKKMDNQQKTKQELFDSMNMLLQELVIFTINNGSEEHLDLLIAYKKAVSEVVRNLQYRITLNDFTNEIEN